MNKTKHQLLILPPGVTAGGAVRGGGGRFGPALGRGGGLAPGLRDGEAGERALSESTNVSVSTSSLQGLSRKNDVQTDIHFGPPYNSVGT